MTKLHLIPGEVPGDTAQIITTPAGVAVLIEVLQRAEREQGYAATRVSHRDGSEHSLTVDILSEHHDRWRDVPIIYVPGQLNRRLPGPGGGLYDLELLRKHFIAARRAKEHTQRQASALMGVSLGRVSGLERGDVVPRPGTLRKFCTYIGSEPVDYKT